MTPLLALLLAAAPLRAQTQPPEGDEVIDAVSAQMETADSPCAEAPGVGCAYVPPGAAERGGVLVYLRGWWGQYHGHVPPKLLTTSARSAFEEFGLKKVADEHGVVVLVTGSSDVAVAEADLRLMERALGRRFSTLAVAAHSGAYAGLTESLPGLRPAERILMLDDFYFPREPLTDLVRARVLAGAKCTGFVTRHNLERWSERFRPFVPCPLDVFENEDHSPAVTRCLGAYLDKTTCL